MAKKTPTDQVDASSIEIRTDTTGATAATAADTATAAATDSGNGDAAPDAAADQLPVDQSDSEAPTIVQARVLAFCSLGAPNDVIEIDAELAKTMRDMVDVTPEAVAYALSIAKE